MLAPHDQDKPELGVVMEMAASGHAEAQHDLGALYVYGGDGVSKDYEKARTWLAVAAEQNVVRAQTLLGWLWYEGLGGLQNYEEAARWYGQAAQQGDPHAMHAMGYLYQNGHGVGTNATVSYFWFMLAAGHGHVEAQARRNAIVQFLRPAQIDKAQRLALRWKPHTH